MPEAADVTHGGLVVAQYYLFIFLAQMKKLSLQGKRLQRAQPQVAWGTVLLTIDCKRHTKQLDYDLRATHGRLT